MTARRNCLLGALLAVAAGSVLAAGCREEVDWSARLQEAARLGAEYQWFEARHVIREFLLRHPGDASAHFLWGQSHLRIPAPRLAIAAGEFETALGILGRGGAWTPLREGMTRGQLEAAIHRESAIVHMRWVHAISASAVPERLVRPRLELALEHVRAGRALDPEDTYLAEMEQTLREQLAPQGGGNAE